MSDPAIVCYYCGRVVTVDAQGVWMDRAAEASCSMSTTGFHHPAGVQPIAEATEESPFAAFTPPPGTTMYVLALDHGAYYSSISYLDPEGPMSKIEAAAMLHQIAAGWEYEAEQETAQTN